MSQKLFFRVSLILFLGFSFEASAGFSDLPPEGFVWYKDADPKPSRNVKKSPPASSKKTHAAVARARNEERKEILEDALQIAIDNPSIENAIKAQKAQKLIFDRSEEFAKAWKMAALLDANLELQKQHTNPLAQKISEAEARKKERKVLRVISKEWRLFLFVKEGCPWCEKFAPILEKFSKRYGFQVLAVSREGGDWGPFEGAKDTGLLAQFNPKGEAPVLFVVHESGQAMFPVARGLVNRIELGKNIVNVVEHAAQRGAKR